MIAGAAAGGDVEVSYVRLVLFQDDRIVRLELFEPEDLDAARTRFAALRPDTSDRRDRTG